MSSGPALLEWRGPLLVITLDRPDTGNALDDAMASALRSASQAAIEADACTVVLLRGTGETFCSGAAPMRAPLEEMATRRVAEAVAAIPKPVLAAVQGDATGQGLELALACDLRIASASARFAMDQVAGGTIPWDGGTQRLPRLLPRGLAMEMLLTGRRLNAREALECGLVFEVVPEESLQARALELAGQLTAMAPIAAAYAKEAILRSLDLPLEQGLRLEADLAILLQSTQDRSEGIRSFLEKRRSRFLGS